MKIRNYKYTSGFLALVCGWFLITSCEPEFEPDLVVYPKISVDEFGSGSGYPGSVVTITGSNFGRHQEAAKVSFNGVLATTFLSYGDSVMEVIVPPLAESGKLSVQVWTHAEDSVGSYTVIPLPVIQSVASSSDVGSNIAFPGDTITITGSGFGTDASKLTITLGGTEGEIISPIQDDIIKVIAPENFPTGNVELTIGGVTLVGEPAIINPTASGDITPYFLENTGDTINGGSFVRGDALTGRWGTLGAPWITNNAALNKEGGTVGGYATEPWGGAPAGYICFETWGTTPVLDGKVYQQTGLELPAGNYTLQVKYYSEVTINSFVHIVAAAGDGIPSLANLDTSLGYVETWNDTPLDATSPNIEEIKELNFTVETPQTVSIGLLVNMQGAAERAGYFKVSWIKLVKN